MPAVSIVIPVYRSRNSLPELATRLEDVFGELNKSYEVIMVDDCSPDDTWHTVSDLAQTHPCFKGVRLMRNMGQTKATMCGIKMATGNIVITMDDDLQHDPAHLPMLLEEFERNADCDCVFAYFPDKKHGMYRNVASKIISWINSQAIGGKRSVRISSFRLMRARIAQIIATNTAVSVTIAGLIFSGTSNVRSIPIPHNERMHGKSNYTLAKQFRAALDNICNVSMMPLRMISLAGLIAAFFSGGLLLHFLLRYFTGGIGVAGWTTVVILISFFSGLILLSLGVIGEYLVRVLRELQSSRGIAVRQCIGFTDQEGLDEATRSRHHISITSPQNEMMYGRR